MIGSKIKRANLFINCNKSHISLRVYISQWPKVWVAFPEVLLSFVFFWIKESPLPVTTPEQQSMSTNLWELLMWSPLPSHQMSFTMSRYLNDTSLHAAWHTCQIVSRLFSHYSVSWKWMVYNDTLETPLSSLNLLRQFRGQTKQHYISVLISPKEVPLRRLLIQNDSFHHKGRAV